VGFFVFAFVVLGMRELYFKNFGKQIICSHVFLFSYNNNFGFGFLHGCGLWCWGLATILFLNKFSLLFKKNIFLNESVK